MKKIRCPNFGKLHDVFGQGCTHPGYDKREELNLCEGMTDSCYVRETNWTSMMGTINGIPSGIMFKGQCVLHLNPGTVINEKYLDEFIAMLNKKGCVIDIEKDEENHGK